MGLECIIKILMMNEHTYIFEMQFIDNTFYTLYT